MLICKQAQCLGPASREVRLCAHLVETILWYGLRRHEHSDRFVEDTKHGSRRRRLEGRGSIGSTNPTNGGLNAAGPLYENFVGGLHKSGRFCWLELNLTR